MNDPPSEDEQHSTERATAMATAVQQFTQALADACTRLRHIADDAIEEMLQTPVEADHPEDRGPIVS